MKLADSGLNLQAEALEEAQTQIRMIIRDGWLNRSHKAQINARVQKVIRAALKEVSIANLREAAVRSLNAFAERQYNTYLREFGFDPTYMLAMSAAAAAPESKQPSLTYETSEHGSPLQEYARDYMRNRVAPVLDRLAAEFPIDPGDVTGRNSLRNRAEMEVRYARHLDEIESLRAAGIKLVTSSVHADCSDRCYKWQGRVYSLDDTSGTTEDGKPYVPLETATDVYYTTKAGKTYKNGLFGFNCRHYIMPYDPRVIIPTVSKETQERERKINTKQRELERKVRYWKIKAQLNKGLPGVREQYLEARKNAIEANREYKKFSKDNGRAYYPSRTKIL